MFKTVIATVAAALIVSTVAAPAQAAGPWVPYNGISLNGGNWFNGSSENGTSLKGSVFAIDGIELPGNR